MAPESQAALAWSLVIPVKVLARAKSRLTGLPGDRRSELALAMAADTVAAALQARGVATVLVITDDPDVSAVATELGATVLADSPAAGLNEALAFGAAYAATRWPGHGRAGLAGDLPALRPEDLAVLGMVGRLGVAFVPDADGTGTTLYAAAPGAEFRPQFGAESRRRHLASGAKEMAGPPGLRRDVDTLDDLRQAAEIGLGSRTRALLAS